MIFGLYKKWVTLKHGEMLEIYPIKAHGRNPWTILLLFSYFSFSSLLPQLSLSQQVFVCVKKEKGRRNGSWREGEERKERKEREMGAGSWKWEEKREKIKERKRKRKREKEWDTCPIVGGWEEIMLSHPSQPRADTWQGESSFYFKTPTSINYIKTLISNNSII
jgi:hypothetical protein